jgi:hypothetical protein
MRFTERRRPEKQTCTDLAQCLSFALDLSIQIPEKQERLRKTWRAHLPLRRLRRVGALSRPTREAAPPPRAAHFAGALS